jgi:hypothetical protein
MIVLGCFYSFIFYNNYVAYKLQMEVIREFGAIVLPMVKHPFVVGFLVVELPELHGGRAMNSYTADTELPPNTFMDKSSDVTPHTAWDIQTYGDQAKGYSQLVNEWKNSALMISRTLAMAYVMDQVLCSFWSYNIQ